MASSGTKEHLTTVTIFNMLAIYKWGVKLVLTLFAFAWNYGQFDAQTEHGAPLKPQFNILKDLIGTALEVTHCVIEFNELPSKYITLEVPALSSAMAQIPSAAYWTVRSIVVCTYQIVSFNSKGYEYVFLSNITICNSHVNPSFRYNVAFICKVYKTFLEISILSN